MGDLWGLMGASRNVCYLSWRRTFKIWINDAKIRLTRLGDLLPFLLCSAVELPFPGHTGWQYSLCSSHGKTEALGGSNHLCRHPSLPALESPRAQMSVNSAVWKSHSRVSPGGGGKENIGQFDVSYCRSWGDPAGQPQGQNILNSVSFNGNAIWDGKFENGQEYLKGKMLF